MGKSAPDTSPKTTLNLLYDTAATMRAMNCKRWKIWDLCKNDPEFPKPREIAGKNQWFAEEIEKYGEPDRSGNEMIFEIREVDRDVSFLRRFLTEEFMREMDMFQHERRGDDVVITHVSDEQSWRQVKDTFLRNVGMGAAPVIRIQDADYQQNRVLYLTHAHDGRDLQLEYAEKTLAYLYQLWGREVLLETSIQGTGYVFSYGEDGFNQRRLRRTSEPAASH